MPDSDVPAHADWGRGGRGRSTYTNLVGICTGAIKREVSTIRKAHLNSSEACAMVRRNRSYSGHSTLGQNSDVQSPGTHSQAHRVGLASLVIGV